MKASLFISLFIFAGVLTAAAAWGNPALLPQHPGYPMGKAIDPVTGQSLANDPGQSNAGGEAALNKASALSDRNLSQQLSSDDLDKRLLENAGAAVQSKGQDPNMDQPTKESTKVHPSPQ